jgi:VWFA-related protein
MKPSSAACFLLLAAAVPSFGAKPPEAPPPTSFGEVMDVNVVNVEVWATDKAGNRITDLRQGDFQLLEDGKPVEISNFETVNGAASSPTATRPGDTAAGAEAGPPQDPWNLVVYFDNQNLRPASRTRALGQLRQFLTTQLRPGDRVMLVTQDLGMNVRLPFTSDPEAIAKALDATQSLVVHGLETANDRRQAFQTMIAIQTDALINPDPLPCPQSIAGPAHSYASGRRQEVLRTIGALTVLVNSLSGVPGRKAVLHVSDGLPMNPGEDLFQFLIEICGGNGTNGGFGRSPIAGGGGSPAGGDDEGGSPRPQKPSDGGPLDPYTIFDARAIGPAAYQAASQGPLDAQSYSVAKNLQVLAAHANAQRVTLYTLQASGLQGTEASEAAYGPEDRLFQFPAIGSVLRTNSRESLQLLAADTGGRAILDANNFLPDLGRMREDLASFYSLGFTPPHNGDGREHKLEVKVKRPGVRLRYRQSYRDKPALEKTVDRTLAALLYGIEDNPLGITVEIGDQTPGPTGTVSVPVRLRIPLFKLAILNQNETFQGSLRVFVTTRNPEGNMSPVRQVPVPLNIPRKQVLNAMGQFYVYTLTLQLPPGQQQVAVAVRDEIATTASYLSRTVTVGTTAAAATPLITPRKDNR